MKGELSLERASEKEKAPGAAAAQIAHLFREHVGMQ